MPEIIQHCPLCKSSQNAVFDRRLSFGHQVVNRLCTNCGLVYQSPRMSALELEAFYAADYRRLYQQTEGPSPKELLVQRRRAEALLEWITGHINTLSNHLDIGCSSGTFLAMIQSQYNTQAIGIEPGAAYRQYAQNLGFTVYPSIDGMANNSPERFQLISMLHVLEHLPDPVAYLQGLRKDRIQPTGWLLLEVPNLYAHDSFEVAHLFAFSQHTLTQVVQKAGFHIYNLRQHGRPRSTLLPLYLTVLAQVDPESPPGDTYRLKRESGVALKRQAGMLRRRIIQRLFPTRAWVPI